MSTIEEFVCGRLQSRYGGCMIPAIGQLTCDVHIEFRYHGHEEALLQAHVAYLGEQLQSALTIWLAAIHQSDTESKSTTTQPDIVCRSLGDL
jgi:hypothetical protein